MALDYLLQALIDENKQLREKQAESERSQSAILAQKVNAEKGLDVLRQDNEQLKLLLTQSKSHILDRERQLKELENVITQQQIDRQQMEDQLKTIAAQGNTVKALESEILGLQKTIEKQRSESQKLSEALENVKSNHQQQLQIFMENTQSSYETRMKEQRVEFDNYLKSRENEIDELRARTLQF